MTPPHPKLMISVIVPCLNDAIHLPSMIDSFLAQDYPHKELVVHDGGSTDGSQEILAASPARWQTARDSGPHDALNRAYRACRGDIIAVMTANDRFEAGAFSRAATLFERMPNAVLVHADCRIVDANGIISGIMRSRTLDLDRFFWQHHVYVQAAFIRREAFDCVGLFDESIRGPGDTDWLLRAFASYPTEAFVYVPEVWGAYRMSGAFDGASFADCAGNVRALEAAAESFLASTENCRRLRHSPARARAGIQILAAFQFRVAGKTQECWRRYWMALRLWPLLWANELGIRGTAKLVAGKKFSENVRQKLMWIRASRYQMAQNKRGPEITR